MRPGGVVVLEVLGQHPPQMVLVDDQKPVKDLPAQGTDHRFAGRVRSRRLRRAGEDPDGFRREHGVEAAGELACPIPDQELDRGRAWPGVHQEIAGCLRRPGAVRVRGDAGQVGAAGAVLDDDQGIDATQQHGIHMDEVNGEDAAGLRGQELLPRWARAAGCGIDPRGMQDLPHRGAGDRVAEPDEFALHATVPPRRIAGRDADHQFPDRGCGRRSSGSPPAGVVPCARGQSPVPGGQRCRGHQEHLALPAAGDQPGQCRKPHPVARLVADPAGLAAQYRVLVPEYQEFGVLGHLTPGQYHQATEQTANKQVDDRKDHSAMIPTRLPAQARSSNRAPQVHRADSPRGRHPLSCGGLRLVASRSAAAPRWRPQGGPGRRRWRVPGWRVPAAGGAPGSGSGCGGRLSA